MRHSAEEPHSGVSISCRWPLLLASLLLGHCCMPCVPARTWCLGLCFAPLPAARPPRLPIVLLLLLSLPIPLLLLLFLLHCGGRIFFLQLCLQPAVQRLCHTQLGRVEHAARVVVAVASSHPAAEPAAASAPMRCPRLPLPGQLHAERGTSIEWLLSASKHTQPHPASLCTLVLRSAATARESALTATSANFLASAESSSLLLSLIGSLRQSACPVCCATPDCAQIFVSCATATSS